MEIIQYTLQEIAWILVQPDVDRTPTADERSALEAASQSAHALACALNEPGLLLPQGIDHQEFAPAGLPPLPRWPLATDASSHVPATDISSASRVRLPHAQYPPYTISCGTHTNVSQARARPPAVPYPGPAQGGFHRVPERGAPSLFNAFPAQAFGGHGPGNGAYFPTSQMAIPQWHSDISASSSLSGALAPFPRVETATPYWDPSSVTPYMESTVFRHHPPGPALFPAPPQINGGMHQARSTQVTGSRPKSLIRGQQYRPGGSGDARRRAPGYPSANSGATSTPTSPPPAFNDVWEFIPYELPPTPAPSSELQVASAFQPVLPPRSSRTPHTLTSNATGPAQAFAAGPQTRPSKARSASKAKFAAAATQTKPNTVKARTSVVPPPVESLAAPASGTSSAKSKKRRAPTEQPVPVIPATTAVPRPKHPVAPAGKPPVANLVASAWPDHENHFYACMVRESADGVPDTHGPHDIDGKVDPLRKHLELVHGFPPLETRNQYKAARRPFPEIACVWGEPSPKKRCEFRCSQDKMALHIRKFHLRADWIRCLYCNEMFERKADYEEHFWECQEYLGTAVPSEGSSWKRRRVEDVDADDKKYRRRPTAAPVFTDTNATLSPPPPPSFPPTSSATACAPSPPKCSRTTVATLPRSHLPQHLTIPCARPAGPPSYPTHAIFKFPVHAVVLALRCHPARRRAARVDARRWVYMKPWRMANACGEGSASGRTGRSTEKCEWARAGRDASRPRFLPPSSGPNHLPLQLPLPPQDAAILAALASGTARHMLAAHLHAASGGSLTALIGHAGQVKGLWQDMVALELYDAPLWDALDLAWEVVLGTLNLAAAQRAVTHTSNRMYPYPTPDYIIFPALISSPLSHRTYTASSWIPYPARLIHSPM
ncbi:hypothetical protein C8R44DRAFT_875622 [Mycena epipterygia]|nr:hypothetical protein C8R44DRAFT_875622 [Mycena epipterygia]